MSVTKTNRREYVEDSFVKENTRQIDLLRSDLCDQKTLNFSQWLMYFKMLMIYEICSRHRRTSYFSQINRSRVESDSSMFCFNQRLTCFYERVVDFVFRVISRLRIDSEREERRLLERCSILKNFLRSAMFLVAWDRFVISASPR
jgi:hypothetical protein